MRTRSNWIMLCQIFVKVPDKISTFTAVSILSGLGFRVTAVDITRLFDATATALRLTASRLLSHSIRFGVIAQFEAALTPVKHCDWHS
jgi:hypothetical protein